MIHFSCDRCHRAIAKDELRFTVSIEIQVAVENQPADEEVLPEEMEVLHEVLDELNEEEREEVKRFAYQRQEHDLCLECQREYLANPLGAEAPTRVGFSEN